MSIKLDNFDLSIFKGEISLGMRSEIRSIKKMATINKRRIVKHSASGLYGTIVEDAGRNATRILIQGQFIGQDALDGITTLRAKYRKGEPVNLISDVSLLSNIDKVMIDELRIHNVSTVQIAYGYEMILREFIEPPAGESAPPPSQQVVAKQEVNSQANESLAAAGPLAAAAGPLAAAAGP